MISEKPLPKGRTTANTSMGNAQGVCGKAQYYDVDQEKCFNIGGGCYSRGTDESSWYSHDIGDFYNMGLPACNFKSNKNISDTPTHDNRTKAGIAKKKRFQVIMKQMNLINVVNLVIINFIHLIQVN